jgi:ribose transport system permease protein
MHHQVMAHRSKELKEIVSSSSGKVGSSADCRTRPAQRAGLCTFMGRRLTLPAMTNSQNDRATLSPFEAEGEFVARLWRALSSIAGAAIGLVLVLAIFGMWRPDKFLSTQNFNNVLLYNYHYVVAAIGATFVIITSGIDLSVGSNIALSSVACALAAKGFQTPRLDWGQDLTIAGGTALIVGLCAAGHLLQRGMGKWRVLGVSAGMAAMAGLAVGVIWAVLAGSDISPMPATIAILIGIAVGGTVGLINGALITTLSLPPFIVTLGTLEGVRGLVIYLTGASPVSNLPPGLLHDLHWSRWLGLPPNVWMALAVVIVAAPILHYTVLGRYTYAIGSNERTARLCGVRVERWKTLCYIIAGLTAGLAGVMMTSQFDSGQPTEFLGSELTIIAAVVIGGTSLFGGEGTVIGSVIGVLMLASLRSGCNIAGINSDLQRVFIGAMIVLAAALDRFRHLVR